MKTPPSAIDVIDPSASALKPAPFKIIAIFEMQTAQKTSETKRAKFDELSVRSSTLKRGGERNEVYEAFSAACSRVSGIRVIDAFEFC
jgi:hypothetical protein